MAVPKIPVSRIILPPEHGSWSLLFEPLAVGLTVAYSPASLWIALMTFGAFFARQPLKTRLLARQNPPVAQTAGKFLILFALLAASGIVGIATTSGAWALFPFIVAAPLALQQSSWTFPRGAEV